MSFPLIAPVRVSFAVFHTIRMSRKSKDLVYSDFIHIHIYIGIQEHLTPLSYVYPTYDALVYLHVVYVIYSVRSLHVYAI